MVRLTAVARHRQETMIALRALARQPGFSLSVMAMFALGIAANTAIFSVFNGLFLSSLPYPEPQRLLYLNEAAPRWNLTVVGVSNPDFYTWHARNQSFSGMAAWSGGSFNLSGSGEAVRVQEARVTYDLAATLGVKPILGRDFLPEEDRKDGRKVALLGYGLWQRKFGRSSDVLGKILQLDNQPYTVVGVLPRTAIYPGEADLWVPLAVDPSAGGSYYLSAVGRLKPGVTIEQARADLTRVHKGMIATQQVNEVTFPTAIPLREQDLGDYRLVTQVLLGAVALVLLIACVNVAGLMMARGTARAREVAIRAALGAGRSKLVRELLAESLLLAIGGGVAGVALGWLGLRSMLSLMPDVLPAWVSFHLDLRFVLFALVVVGAAAAISGLGPALESSKVDVRGFLADAAPKTSLSGARRRSMNVLVAGEIALALVLLASAGLLVRAFQKVSSVDPGFRAQNVLTFQLDLPETKYKSEQRIQFLENLLTRMRSAPGIESAGAASHVPLGGHTGSFFQVEGARPLGPNEQDPVIATLQVSRGYFEAMGIAMASGRDFDGRDGTNKGNYAAVVSEAFARRYWPAGAALGKRVAYRGETNPVWLTVVGVARDTRHYGLDQEVRPTLYMPYRQQADSGMSIAVRSRVDPQSLIAASREIMRQLDPGLALYDVRTMQERLERSLWARRTYSWLFAVFAGMALLLAVAGIYGVVSYTVTQRTREIGIRMALGAEPRQVLGQVLREGMLLAGIGVAIGLGGALIAARSLQALLAGVSPRDPWAFAGVSLALGLAALAANLIPARRAASVEPMRALHFE